MSAVGAVEGDWEHYDDVIMSERASQITTIITIVYSIVYSDVDQRKHQSSASLAIVRGIHWEPAQMASYAENVSIWWRHHERSKEYLPPSTSDCSTRATSCVVLPTLFSAMKWYDRKCCRKTRLKWRVIPDSLSLPCGYIATALNDYIEVVMKHFLDIYSIDIGSSRTTLSKILDRYQNFNIEEDAFGMTVAKWGSFCHVSIWWTMTPKIWLQGTGTHGYLVPHKCNLDSSESQHHCRSD